MSDHITEGIRQAEKDLVTAETDVRLASNALRIAQTEHEMAMARHIRCQSVVIALMREALK